MYDKTIAKRGVYRYTEAMKAEELQTHLKNLKLSQVLFSYIVGCGKNTVNLWVKGQRSIPPTIDCIIMLLNELPTDKYLMLVDRYKEQYKKEKGT